MKLIYLVGLGTLKIPNPQCVLTGFWKKCFFNSTNFDIYVGSDESSSTRVTPQQHSEPKKLNLNGNGNGVLIDEHSLIAQYCQKLHNGDLLTTVPDSPLQLMAEIDAEQRHELELMIRELETENANLQVCSNYSYMQYQWAKIGKNGVY